MLPERFTMLSTLMHLNGAVSFVFAGSRRSLLLQMFSDQKRFLTLSANKEFLPPLPVDETATCIHYSCSAAHTSRT